MRFHIRVNDKNAVHTHFSLFVDGACAGPLCMRNEEFDRFRHYLQWGIVHGDSSDDVFQLTGPTLEAPCDSEPSAE